MRALDVMTTGVQAVSPTSAAEDAWQLMQRQRIHHLAVTQGSQLVGVLSDRDVASRRGGDVRKGQTVGDLMIRNLVTVEATTSIRKVANLMRGRSIGCVLVTQNDRLVGIITITDLLELLGRGIDRPAIMGKRPALHHRAPHRKKHRSTGM